MIAPKSVTGERALRATKIFVLMLVMLSIPGMAASGCARIQPVETSANTVITEESTVSGLNTIRTIAPHMDELDAEFAKLPNPSDLGRDYFDAQETDKIESLLFRFLGNQTTLWDLIDSLDVLMHAKQRRGDN